MTYQPTTGGRGHCIRDGVTQSRAPAVKIRTSADVYALLRERLAPLYHEQLIAVGLDCRGRAIREILIAQGGLTGCVMSPRDAFRRILAEPVATFVLVHNHPSGDPAPSVEDARLTERMDAAARLLGLPMLDHVIIGADGYFSFADAGLLIPSEAIESAR